MRRLRRISVPAHGLVELAVGLALVAGSLALDLGLAGLLATFAAGIVLAGVGLGAGENLPLAMHRSLDRWLITVLSLASVGLALAGDGLAAALLLAVAAGLCVLTGATRWSRPAARRPAMR